MSDHAPFVVAACPAKVRGWCIAAWYRAVSAQSRRPDLAYVLLNDDDGHTEPALLRAFHTAAVPALPLVVGHLDTGGARTGHARIATPDAPRYDIAHLARVRNEVVTRVLRCWPQATHLLLCDSDVAPDADVLARLLATGLPIVAAVVANNADGTAHNFWCGTTDMYEATRTPGAEAELAVLHETAPQRVTMTGACVLVARVVVEHGGVRYGMHANGEDVFWSMAARAAGYKLHVDPRARTRHMQPGGEVWR